MGNEAKGFEFRKFATPRIIGSIAIAIIRSVGPDPHPSDPRMSPSSKQTAGGHAVTAGHGEEDEAPVDLKATASHETGTQPATQAAGPRRIRR